MLKSFEALGVGEEAPVLPKGEELVGEKFVCFPEESRGLIPAQVQLQKQQYSRFSNFKFPEVILQGMRLFSVGSDFFNDASLVDQKNADEDFTMKLRAGYSEQVQYDPFSDTVLTAIPSQTIDCDGCAVIASNEPNSFGSWLFRVLPKVLLNKNAAPVNRVMVSTEMPWVSELLWTFAPGIEIIPHLPNQAYRLFNPLIPALASTECFHRREIQEALQPTIERATRAMPHTPEKVYISRRKMALAYPSHRVLENETELIERLLRFDFHEVFPEDMTPLEQVAVFAQAKVIVSVGGSNLFGCYFARNAEMIIDLESSEIFQKHHSNVLLSCGCPFTIARGIRNERGRHEHHMNWTIDVDTLIAGLIRMGVIG